MPTTSPSPSSPDSGVSARGGVVCFGDCRFDPDSGLLWRDDKEVPLAPRPLRLLQVMIESPDRVLERSELLEKVWIDEFVEEDALTQAVSVLRSALGDDRRDARYIKTVHGRGYRFVAEVERAGEEEPAADSRQRSRAVAVVIGLVAIGALAWAGARSAGTPDPAPLRYTLALPDGYRVAEYSPGALALASDGSVALVGYGEEGARILLKRPGDFDLRPLEGTRHGASPFFSPDGTRMAFFESVSSTLEIVELSSVTRRTIASVSGPPNRGTWGADGAIYFTDGNRGLLRVDPEGGEPEVVATPSAGRGETRFLDVARAGGDELLVTVGLRGMSSWSEARLQRIDPRGGEAEPLLVGALAPVVLDGRLFFAREGRLMSAVLEAGEIGTSRTVFEGLSTSGLTGAASFALGSDGKLAFVEGGELTVRTRAVIVGREGGRTPIELRPDTYIGVDVSRDGNRLALWTGGEFGHVWTHDLARGTTTRQTRDWQNMLPLWRPGRDQIVYASVRSGRHELRLKAAEHSSDGELLLTDDRRVLPGSWSPDGEALLYVRDGDRGDRDIWRLELSSGETAPLLASRYDERGPAISPDGRWLAYTSDETGERELYLSPLDAPETRVRVSPDGAGSPRWSADGRRIVYPESGERIVAARVEAMADGTPVVGRPETLLEGMFLPRFATLPDGGLVVIEELPTPPPVRRVNIVHGGDPANR